MYVDFSVEDILCIYIKRLLDRKLHINFPNRNTCVHSLFDTISLLKDMNDYTIVKFDFQDFFNSISSTYVYSKILKKLSFERYQLRLIKDFVQKTKYTYAGLSTSNILCEIIAKEFDELLLNKLCNYGVIYHKRYVDDSIVIMNSFIKKNQFELIVSDCINEIFYDRNIEFSERCTTKLNLSKTKYISMRDLKSSGSEMDIDFLGYLFRLKYKPTNRRNAITEIKYGITDKKIDKYKNKINAIVVEFTIHKNMELLRHQLKAFCSRTVYQIIKYKSLIWKTKGFISNYNELRFRTDLLIPETKNFLKNSIADAFRNNGISIPYFLKGNLENSPYNLYNNLINNETMLFVEKIGIGRSKLEKLCSQVGIDISIDRSYDSLVREYLIKVKIGH